MINISLIEFTRRVYKSGKLSLKGVFLLPIYYIQIIAGLPFAFVQYLLYHSKIKKTTINKSPIFILGHYRSGTTYLQKLMVSNKNYGYLTNFDALFPNSNLLFGNTLQKTAQYLINIFKIKNPFFHNSIVQLSEPTEEDDYLMNKSSAYTAYWGLVFPLCWRQWLNGSTQFANQQYIDEWKNEYLQTLKYATYKSGGKQLVLKSPPNTERIRLLLQLFPDAKFIYIYRNPYHLYFSMKNMWKNTILNYYSVQKISDEALDEIIFEHFIYLSECYERDKEFIPKTNLVEISYEDLKADSFNIINDIYIQLNLPDFDLIANDLLNTLGFEKEYQNFQLKYNDIDIKKISAKWGNYIQKWHYEYL